MTLKPIAPSPMSTYAQLGMRLQRAVKALPRSKSVPKALAG